MQALEARGLQSFLLLQTHVSAMNGVIHQSYLMGSLETRVIMSASSHCIKANLVFDLFVGFLYSMTALH